MSQLPAEIAKVFSQVFNLKAAPQSRVLRPMPDGSFAVQFMNQSNRPLSKTYIQMLGSASYGKKGTVEDFDYRVTAVKKVLGERASHLSAFLAINESSSDSGVETYTLSYSTDVRCLFIQPVS